MFRRQHSCAQLLGLAVFLTANCGVSFTAAAQTSTTGNAANCSAYASVPLPAEAQEAVAPKIFPACASYRSYRGVGRPVNYSEARACAWSERLAQEARLPQNPKVSTAWVVGGSLILADIYFNGSGVKRNVPLALRLACEFEEGAVELALPDIAKLNGERPAKGPFEFCDYATTTFTMNFCTGYESEVADDRRNRYYDSLKSLMTAEQKTAFEKLLVAQRAYIDAHASEVYQGGTIHGIRTIRSEDILNDLFRTELVHFERKRWPSLSTNRIAAADDLLNREYEKTLQQLRKQTKEEIEDGAVTAEGLTSAQREWETYRDAWFTFARLRYPDAAETIRAQVTLDRYRLLKTVS